jgi:hypothetical protein
MSKGLSAGGLAIDLDRADENKPADSRTLRRAQHGFDQLDVTAFDILKLRDGVAGFHMRLRGKMHHGVATPEATLEFRDVRPGPDNLMIVRESSLVLPDQPGRLLAVLIQILPQVAPYESVCPGYGYAHDFPTR